MEAIQSLYIRELITAERVVGVVRRFTALQGSTELPADQEEALLLWINKACARLRGQIAAEVREVRTGTGRGGACVVRWGAVTVMAVVRFDMGVVVELWLGLVIRLYLVMIF